uniref:Uncharacterized protein n=1 Tax=Anguilla anguilla TaxID=7936 RepID=A0A0E9XY17_ANGAN
MICRYIPGHRKVPFCFFPSLLPGPNYQKPQFLLYFHVT